MSQILNKVRDLDPHDVDAAKEALSSFFPNLAKHKDGDCVRWLRTLENVINRFPRHCGSQRATIEKYITFFLDTSSYSAAIEAARCAHALQQVRPGQEKAATPKVCWRDLMTALCNAVHSLISELFPNATDIYRTNGEQEKKSSDSILLSALDEISVISGQDRILNRENVLSTRLRNIFVFIQAMLVEIYPVAKPVRPQLILDAIIRALAAGASQSTELVCAVKRQALSTLDALVACLGANMIPFSPLVFKCVIQTLRWSSENPSQQSSVRIAAYSSLGVWLTSLRAHRGPARSWRELVTHVCSDVTPHTQQVQLTMNNPPRNLSKKQKKKQVRVALQQSSIAAYSPNEAGKLTTSAESHDQTAIAALECTEIFLTVCGIFLEPATHKTFHELLVRECFLLDDYSSERGLALLRALEASRRSAPPGVPPPTQYCLQLYSARINSQHREISKFCSQALLDIRLHLHCSPPSLSFAAEAQKETKKDAEEKRRMSRRNREALESFLGADKIPPETSDTEAPEPEEPVNKKPRTDDVSDKISLSSASEDSVEICDSDSEIEEVPMIPETSILEVHAEIHNNTEDSPENINEEPKINEVSENINELPNIHEATTQVYDTVDGESLSGKSNEVGYGYTNTRSVPVLENIEDDLPNTDETDDVHITCGQTVTTPDELKESGEVKDEVNVNAEVKDEVKVNGVKSPEADENVVEGSVTVKMVANGVSVQDMLADFVDEVNEDITQA